MCKLLYFDRCDSNHANERPHSSKLWVDWKLESLSSSNWELDSSTSSMSIYSYT